MKDSNKSILLFLFACIPSRLALTALAKYIPPSYLPYMGLITLGMAVGFIYLYFSGKRESGPETFGKPIWWKNFRIIHGLNYLLFSYMAFQKSANAYLVLLYDTLFGLMIFLKHHFL
jgi:hypothetical protein